MIDWPWARSSADARGVNWPEIRHCFSIKENWHSLFKRESQHYAALDGLRAMSVIYLLFYHAFHLVFLFHSADEQRTFFAELSVFLQAWVFGDRAVDAFFVLSGFLVSHLLFVEYEKRGHVRVGRFLWRRFMRLSPLYYALILVFALFAAPWVELKYYLANLLYLNNFLPIEHQYIPFTWSLAIEEQFYLFLALFIGLVFFRVKHKYLLLLALWIGSALLRLWTLSNNPELLVQPEQLYLADSAARLDFAQQIYTNTFMRIGPLLNGLVLAYLYHFHRSKLRWLAEFAGGVILVAGFVVPMILVNHIPAFGQNWSDGWLLAFLGLHRHIFALAVSCLMLLLLFPSHAIRPFQRIFTAAGWLPLARLSFAMYLGHLPVMLGIYPVLAKYGLIGASLSFENVLILLAYALPLTLFGSVVVYCLLEKPFLRLRDVNWLIKR